MLGCLVGWPVGWLVGWLAGWLTGCLVAWLLGCLAGWLVGWLAGWLVGWLVAIWYFHSINPSICPSNEYVEYLYFYRSIYTHICIATPEKIGKRFQIFFMMFFCQKTSRFPTFFGGLLDPIVSRTRGPIGVVLTTPTRCPSSLWSCGLGNESRGFFMVIHQP